MNITEYVLIFIMIMIGVFGTIAVLDSLHALNPDNFRKIEVSCYDRLSHKIEGLTCEKEIICGWGFITEVCDE